jgi:hypothetical protein
MEPAAPNPLDRLMYNASKALNLHPAGAFFALDSFQTSYRFLFPPVAFPADPDPLGRPAGAFFALDSFPLLLRSSCTWIPGNQEVTSNLGMVCVFRGMNRK